MKPKLLELQIDMMQKDNTVNQVSSSFLKAGNSIT